MFMLMTISTWLVSIEHESLVDALTLCACNSDLFDSCLSSVIATIRVGNAALWMHKHGPHISCFSSLHYSRYEELMLCANITIIRDISCHVCSKLCFSPSLPYGFSREMVRLV
jgi:hypothetical protein